MLKQHTDSVVSPPSNTIEFIYSPADKKMNSTIKKGGNAQLLEDIEKVPK